MSKPKTSPAFNPATAYSEASEVRREDYLRRVARGEIKIPGVPAIETIPSN